MISIYFYIDYRDCGYGAGAGSNDITVRTDRDWGFFISSGLNTNVPDNGQSPTTCGFSEISLGQVIRIGEINSYESYETDCMDNYWSNCLVLVNDNWNPHIVWGAHPTFNPISGYKIYRKVVNYGQNPGQPASWPLLTTVNANTFSYKDIEFRIGGTSYQAYYYVRAYYSSIQSDLTNIVNSAVQYYKNKNESEAQSITGFILEQNFPNPFNPTTKITYSIPEESFIQLKVFDPFGNEVSLLVNEKKDKGIYEVEFDASNFASGIYFYQLKTNNFISTKKMIVLK